MKLNSIYRVCLILFVVVSIPGCGSVGRLGAVATEPLGFSAPAGYRWELIDRFSDEFDGTTLDRTKWRDHFEGWQGRVPGLFVPEAVSVDGGTLNIRSTVLDPPRGDFDEWTIACGAIQSLAEDASYGYYEVRVRASNVSTSTTFWLMNRTDGQTRPYKRTELDILECIGHAQTWPDFGNHMMSNTHVTYYPEDPAAEPINLKAGARTPLGASVADDYHTYGCWWVDATTMHFYLDGKYAHTIRPSTEVDARPFDQRLRMNLVCEIYDWEVTPTIAEISDDSRNLTRYDYVRAFRLVKTD